MRAIYGLGAALAAMSTMQFSNVHVATDFSPVIEPPKTKRPASSAPSRRYRAGKSYPHSSTRQRARYARQLAAGQLNIERV